LSSLILPESARNDETRTYLRNLACKSTFFMGKAIIGFKDLVWGSDNEPGLHREMADWIDNGRTHKHGIVPRDHLKTSVWTIANSVRRIVAKPDIRILIGNETATNASHWLMRIEGIWQRNNLFQWLFPELIPDFGVWKRWNQTEMVVPRDNDYPEATIEVIGVGGAVVSRHYNLIKLDDLIGKEASESADVMRKSIDWYQYCESLLEDPNRDEIHNFGTPWGFADLDAWIRKNEDYVDFFFRGCYDHAGDPIWPERFDRVALERIRKKYGSFKFSCQYLCVPRDPEAGGLNTDDLRFYEWRDGCIVPRSGSLSLVIDPLRDLSRSIRVDPAISEKSGAARSAIIVDGVYKDERIFLLEAWAKRCEPFKMIDQIFEFASKWSCTDIAFESVAYQRILKPVLEAECDRRGVWLNIIEVKPDTKERKVNRIRGRVQPYLERHQIFVNQEQHAEFIEEMADFPTGSTMDLIDAFAYGPDVWGAPVEDDSEEQLDEWRANESGRSSITGY
jgi:predicted phage terminase large subunit-like protein